MNSRITLSRWTGALVLLACAACAGDSPTASAPESARATARTLRSMTCNASVKTGTLSCADNATGRRVIYGSQGQDVRVRSYNLHYNPLTGLYVFDVNVQNLLPVAIGTRDGVTLDPKGVRLFFSSGPTVTSGIGVVAVVNPDGLDLFNTQGSSIPIIGPSPYYQWNQVLQPGQTSVLKEWVFLVPVTVTNFTFNLYVSTEVAPS